MAITVTPNLTLLAACDALSSTNGVWTGGTELLLDTIMQTQNTGCISGWISNTLSPLFLNTLTTAQDMSNNSHLFVWVMCTGRVDTKANGGYRLYAEDSSGNYSVWYAGGNDTHAGGWQLMCVSLAATRTSGSGTLNTASIKKFGVYFKTITTAPSVGQNKFNNCFIDVCRYGTGLTITSGATDQITPEAIYQVDNAVANKYGVVQKIFDNYILNGALIFADTSTASIDFIAQNQIFSYPDNNLVSATFNKIEVRGNATGTSNFVLDGSFIRALNQPVTIDLDGANLNTITVTGNTIVKAGSVSFTSNQTITNNVFSGCGQIVPGASTFESNTIKSTTSTSGALLWNESIDISDCYFMSNTTGAAIQMPSAAGTPYTFDALFFSSNTYDVNNTSGSTIAVSLINGSDASTYTGTLTEFETSVTVTVKVLNDETGLPIGTTARVRIMLDSDKSVLLSEACDANGIVTTLYSGTIPADIIGWAREFNISNPDFVQKDFSGEITSAGFNLTIRLEPI